jgi:hypothetical protein
MDVFPSYLVWINMGVIDFWCQIVVSSSLLPFVFWLLEYIAEKIMYCSMSFIFFSGTFSLVLDG